MIMSKKRLKKLESMDDKDIDFSDNPETDSAFWENATIVEPEVTSSERLRTSKNGVAGDGRG